jgi:zinc protease
VNLPIPAPLTSDVIRTKLPNGLTLLVKEIRELPVVAIDTWVKAGYFNEADDEVGISHVIEHMFFKGTRARPRPDQIASEVKALGGELNAGTYYDFTHYYFALPSESFTRGLQIQADALMDPLVDPDELSRELEAIIQEGKRKLDNPSAFAAERLYELSYRVHRIRRWRIGEEDSLRTFTREKLLRYYQRHYSAENIILTVVGDVTSGRVQEDVLRLFGGLRAGSGPGQASPPEPQQDELRFQILRGDIKRALLLVGFRSAPLFHPDDLPSRVLASVLGRGRSSRLHQEVKEKRGCVESISAGTEVFTNLGTFRITADLEPAQLARATEAIAGVFEGMRSKGPEEAEIQRARSAVESVYYLSQADVLGVATNLSYYEALGDFHLADEFVRKLQGVTPEAVTEAARKMLKPENAALLAYIPEDGKPALEDREEAHRLLAATRLSLVPVLPKIPEESRRSPAPGSSALRGEAPRRMPLPGGATLLVEEIPRLPVTSVAVLFKGGRVHESPENSGISRLGLAVMSKGTRRRDALRLAVEMESFGCSLDRVFDDDYLGLSISILTRFLPGGLDLVGDVLRRPSFPVEEIERERRVQRAAMESLKDQAMGYAGSLFRQAAYPEHPYGLAPYGTPESVDAIDLPALELWHAGIFRPANMVVAVAGDLRAEAVQSMIAERMEGWESTGSAPEEPRVAPKVMGVVSKVETRKKAQTFQILGFPSVDLHSPSKYPLDLLQSVVSGLGGVFFEAIRGKRGLAYVVGASSQIKRLGGYFIVYLGTSPDKEEEARRILLEEVEAIRSAGIPEQEIQRARASLLGTYPFSLQTHSARALSYAAAEILEKGMEEVLAYPEKIREVTPRDVAESARRFLTPDCYALGVVRGA